MTPIEVGVLLFFMFAGPSIETNKTIFTIKALDECKKSCPIACMKTSYKYSHKRKAYSVAECVNRRHWIVDNDH